MIAAAVVLVGGIGAYFYLKLIPGKRAADPTISAEVVPEEAMMAGYISADIDAWSQLQKFGSAEAHSLVTEELSEAKDNVEQGLAKYDLTYKQDLQPWLGSAMFAMLPPPRSESGATPGGLIVVGIKDKVAALNFFNKVKDQDVKTTQSNYKGVDLIEITEGLDTPAYLAVLDDHIALAFQKSSVEQAIDTFKGEPSLASRPGAAQALAKVSNFDTLIAQFYLPDYGDTIKQLLAFSPQASSLPPEFLDQLEQVESMAFGVGMDPAGIRIKMAAKVDPAQFKWEYKPVPSQVVAQFPAETIVLISGGGIDRQWSAMVEQLESTSPEFRQGLEEARTQIKQQTQLDLDKDIFGWMDGDYAFGLVPSEQGITAAVGFGAALVMDTSDRNTAQTTFKTLDSLVQSSPLSLAAGQVGAVTLTEWKAPNRETLFGHGWLDQDTLVLAIGGRQVAEAVTTKPRQSLKDSRAFQTITSNLPQPNAGYFYLDMYKTLALLKSNPTLTQGGGLPPELDAILSSIRGIGMATTQSDQSLVQWEALIALRPKN